MLFTILFVGFFIYIWHTSKNETYLEEEDDDDDDVVVAPLDIFDSL